MMTLVTTGWCSSHASAICATLTPFASAIPRITSMTSYARSCLHWREVERRPPAAGFAAALARVLAAQQAAGQRAPHQQAKALALQHRRDLALEIASGDGVVRLQRLEPRQPEPLGDAERLGDLPRRPVRDADVADLPLLHQVSSARSVSSIGVAGSKPWIW